MTAYEVKNIAIFNVKVVYLRYILWDISGDELLIG